MSTSSIYSIKNWTEGETYKKNSIVRRVEEPSDQNNLPTVEFYYSTQEIQESKTEPENSPLWGGYFKTGESQKKPYFLWKPSYNNSVTHAPASQIAKFGDGYEQRFKKGIFNNYIEIALTFEHRDTNEARCINHFLTARQGTESFHFKHIPELHADNTTESSYKKLFVCEKWNSQFVFYNNHTITATFRQVNI